MQADTRPNPPAQLQSLAALAGLLERLEQQPLSASAEQYRSVARQLGTLLAEAQPGAPLDALLAAAPAAAAIYENLHYHLAGLCRSPLEASLNAELAAHAAIDKASRRR